VVLDVEADVRAVVEPLVRGDPPQAAGRRVLRRVRADGPLAQVRHVARHVVLGEVRDIGKVAADLMVADGPERQVARRAGAHVAQSRVLVLVAQRDCAAAHAHAEVELQAAALLIELLVRVAVLGARQQRAARVVACARGRAGQRGGRAACAGARRALACAGLNPRRAPLLTCIRCYGARSTCWPTAAVLQAGTFGRR